jgi:hypothetical protein
MSSRNPTTATNINTQTPINYPDTASQGFAADEFYTASSGHPLAQFGTISRSNNKVINKYD